MTILDFDITTQLSKRPNKSKQDIISSQMNDTLQSMAEAAKARIKASKANAESYKRYTIDEVSSNTAPTNDFSLGSALISLRPWKQSMMKYL